MVRGRKRPSEYHSEKARLNRSPLPGDPGVAQDDARSRNTQTFVHRKWGVVTDYRARPVVVLQSRFWLRSSGTVANRSYLRTIVSATWQRRNIWPEFLRAASRTIECRCIQSSW